MDGPTKKYNKNDLTIPQVKYLEISSLIQGFWRTKYSHFPFSEVILNELYPETLDGFFLKAFVFVRKGSVGTCRQVLIVSHKYVCTHYEHCLLQRRSTHFSMVRKKIIYYVSERIVNGSQSNHCNTDSNDDEYTAHYYYFLNG